jgi:hypothetical protein
MGARADVIGRRWPKRVPGSPWVFRRCGRRVGSFQRQWGRARAAVGLEGKRFHDFTRTAARDKVDAGSDPFTAIKVAAHRSLWMFQRDKIVTTDRMAEPIRAEARDAGAAGAARVDAGSSRECGQKADRRVVSA